MGRPRPCACPRPDAASPFGLELTLVQAFQRLGSRNGVPKFSFHWKGPARERDHHAGGFRGD